MLNFADNEMLTRTNAGTPMGELFRSFWIPVLLSNQLPEADCAQLRVRVLGEDLLAFRDSSGRPALIEPRCSHRGANLFFGRNEQGGIRCAYHGWKFDADGECVDMPTMPPERVPELCAKARIRAYPARDWGDLVWAYLGPRRPLPELPQMEFALVPPSHRHVSKKLQECNWAQAAEGGVDTAHFSFLHMPAPGVPSDENPDAPADAKRLRWIRNDPQPRFSILEHDVGFVVGGARRTEGRELYWRTAQFALPSHSTTPSTLPGENYFGYTFVPIDDASCWIYTYVWNPERELTDQERSQLASGHGVVAEVGPDFVPLRNRGNEYLLDRDDQRHLTYTGVRGVAEQDAMIQESQGPIADRTREHLTPTDAAIVRFRRTLLNGAKALRDGTEPQAPWRHDSYRLRSGSWLADQGVSFEAVMQERFGDPFGRAPASRDSHDQTQETI